MTSLSNHFYASDLYSRIRAAGQLQAGISGKYGLDTKTLAELTTEIVAAYVAHHHVSATDLPAVIGKVGGRMAALAAVEEKKEAAPVKPEPAVPVRRSIGREHLTCLVCGKPVRTLKRHLGAAHGLTPAAYRELFGLKRDYPMTAPALNEQRAEIARRTGLGRRRPAPEPAPQPVVRAGRRRRAAEPAQEAAPQPTPQPGPQLNLGLGPRRPRRTKAPTEGTAVPA